MQKFHFLFLLTLIVAGRHWKLASTPLNLTSCTRGCSSASWHRSLQRSIGRILVQSWPSPPPTPHNTNNNTHNMVSRQWHNTPTQYPATGNDDGPRPKLQMWPIFHILRLSSPKQSCHQAAYCHTCPGIVKPQRQQQATENPRNNHAITEIISFHNNHEISPFNSLMRIFALFDCCSAFLC